LFSLFVRLIESVRNILFFTDWRKLDKSFAINGLQGKAATIRVRDYQARRARNERNRQNVKGQTLKTKDLKQW